jgi:hypothetical protein
MDGTPSDITLTSVADPDPDWINQVSASGFRREKLPQKTEKTSPVALMSSKGA